MMMMMMSSDLHPSTERKTFLWHCYLVSDSFVCDRQLKDSLLYSKAVPECGFELHRVCNALEIPLGPQQNTPTLLLRKTHTNISIHTTIITNCDVQQTLKNSNASETLTADWLFQSPGKGASTLVDQSEASSSGNGIAPRRCS